MSRIKPSVKYRHMGNPNLVYGLMTRGPTKSHNQRSWYNIAQYMMRGRAAPLNELTKAVLGHQCPNPTESREQDARNFVLYCMDLGWLKVQL